MNNPQPNSQASQASQVQLLTDALDAGYRPSIREIADLLYALQSAIADDDDVMLWMNNTPESLADELVKSLWMSGSADNEGRAA